MADLTDKFKPNANRRPLSQKALDEIVLESAASQDARTLTLALMAGGSANAKNSANGEPALIYSASHGNTEQLKLLLEFGADVNGCDNFGQTAPMEALHGRHEKALQFLLSSGYDIDHRDTTNNTLLMHAVRGLEWKPVRIVLDHDPDPFVKDGKGRTARMILEDMHEVTPPEMKPSVDRMLSMIIRHEERYYSYLASEAVDRKDYKELETLAQAGPEMGRTPWGLGQALIIAVKAMDEKAVEIILAGNPDINAHDPLGCSVRAVMNARQYEAGNSNTKHDQLDRIQEKLEAYEASLSKATPAPSAPKSP
ncbi:MAG: ankyrin repeat domain-containing protein [Alphaproteobacteria bacterium]